MKKAPNSTISEELGHLVQRGGKGPVVIHPRKSTKKMLGKQPPEVPVKTLSSKCPVRVSRAFKKSS